MRSLTIDLGNPHHIFMSATQILCVDDDLAVLNSLKGVLVYSGFEVVAVSNVPDALNLISRRHFDVLLTDLNIGEPGDGFTVVSAMRRVQPEACSFILTGYPDIESAIQGIRNQVDDYFSKPLNVEELLVAISAARAGKRPLGKIATPLRVSEFIRKNIPVICERWLEEVLKDPEIAAIPLSREERLDHVPELLHELAFMVDGQDVTLTDKALEGARRHGRVRYEQGYDIAQIVFEARVLQQVLSFIVQSELLSIDLSSLVPDTFKIGECIQSALEVAIRIYQAQIPHSLQASFLALYQSPHLGVAIADEHRIIDANDALLKIMQYTRDELAAGDVDWAKLTPEEYRELDLNGIEQLREYGVCVPFEKEFMLRNGSKVRILVGAVRLSLEPFQWSVYVVDLTEQRKLLAAEHRVREWKSRYAMINRLAHEINNPLAALTFTIHLLGTDSDLSSNARELAGNADEMLGRVTAVVKQVLEESQRAW